MSGEFLPRDSRRAGLDPPRGAAVEHDEVGGLALHEPAARSTGPSPARTSDGPVVSAATARAQRQPAGVDRREHQAERGLDPR